MIKVMSYELNGRRVKCLYDKADWLWFVIDRGHKTCFSTFEEASEKMDEAIQKLLGEREG